MPGNVLDVVIREGQHVAAGDALVMLEERFTIIAARPVLIRASAYSERLRRLDDAPSYSARIPFIATERPWTGRSGIERFARHRNERPM